MQAVAPWAVAITQGGTAYELINSEVCVGEDVFAVRSCGEGGDVLMFCLHGLGLCKESFDCFALQVGRLETLTCAP
jgi:hypothetical protein